MRAWTVSWLVAAAACHPAAVAPASSPFAPPSCAPGSVPVFEGDSDVGWGEVEQTVGCAPPRRRPHGPAIETLESAPGQPSTRLVGRLDDGRRVGTWTQYDAPAPAGTGRVLGRFTLDDAGTGTLEIRDQLGHLRRGRVVAGDRDGTWTDYDAAGTPVATQVWSRGKLIGGTGSVPWDPPMIDPSDQCPDDPGPDADGCPTPASKTGHGRPP
jgi:hypothetical protein